MENTVNEKIEILKAYAKSDRIYAKLHREALVLEREFELALLDLPEETQDTVWRYLFHCEEQSERLLELAMSQRMDG